jgi:hypothetical protein
MTRGKALHWVMWAAVAALAGCTSSATKPADLDPQAGNVLKHMCDTLSAVKSMTFESDALLDDRLPSGQLVQLHRHSKVTAVRPCCLFIDMTGDQAGGSLWYCKGHLTIMDRRSNIYASAEVPDRTEKMLDHVIDKYHLTVPLADILFPNLYETLTEHVESGLYVGVEDVDGHACHHLSFTQKRLDWQIWIDAGAQSLPRQIVITYKEEEGLPQYTATLDKWDLAASPPETMFHCQPPKDAKAVSMDELMVREKQEKEGK